MFIHRVIENLLLINFFFYCPKKVKPIRYYEVRLELEDKGKLKFAVLDFSK